MQKPDTLLDLSLDQFIDSSYGGGGEESSGGGGGCGLKGSNSFLSLSDIIDNSISQRTEYNFPNQEIQLPLQETHHNNTPSSGSSSSSYSLDDLSTFTQFNLVSQFYPLFESLFKGLSCNSVSPNFIPQTVPFPSNNNHIATIQPQLFPSPIFNVQNTFPQPTQSMATTTTPPPLNSSTSTCPAVNNNHSNIHFANSTIQSTRTSPTIVDSIPKTTNGVKIQKSTTKRKKKQQKIVLCNNEYEEKLFKLRNPNQTYYKFVER